MTRENGNQCRVGRAEIPVQVVVLDKPVAEEQSAIVSSSIRVEHLITLAEVGERGNHERLFVRPVFPGRLARARVIQHIGQGNQNAVADPVENTSEVATMMKQEVR